MSVDTRTLDRISACLAEAAASVWIDANRHYLRTLWATCARRHGVGSPAARGVLLDLVRAAWDDEGIHVIRFDGRWWVRRGDQSTIDDADGETELEALTCALERRPRGES